MDNRHLVNIGGTILIPYYTTIIIYCYFGNRHMAIGYSSMAVW